MGNASSVQGAAELTPERSRFIVKVYGLLTLSILSAVVGSQVGSSVFGPTTAMMGPMQLGGLLALIAAMVFRHVPILNLGLLFGFTFLNGMMMGPYLSYLGVKGHGLVVQQAGITTLGTFVALTAYVFWSRTNFSYLRGFLWSGLWGLILVGFVGFFTGMSSAMHLVYCYAGVLIFVGFVLYDTSNLINRESTTEYVSATLDLYLDLLNLFRFILQIFLSRDSD